MNRYENDFGASSNPKRRRSDAYKIRRQLESAVEAHEQVVESNPNPSYDVPPHVTGPQHIVPNAKEAPKLSDDPVLMNVLNNLEKLITEMANKKALSRDDNDLLNVLSSHKVRKTIEESDPELSAALARIFVDESAKIDDYSINDIEETEGNDITDALARLRRLKENNDG